VTLRRIKVNASANVSPSQYDSEVDEQFMQDVGSIIALEDGSSLDLKKAVLLYNPKSKKIQLTDSDMYPADFVQVAVLDVTSQKPEVIGDEQFEEPTEETAEESESEGTGETESGDDDMGETAAGEDSGDFFQ
jgi:hypothetical protein